jgi:hypothetical protein
MIAVTVCATKSYCYAMRTQARLVASNIFAAKVPEGVVVLIGDDSDELKAVEAYYPTVLPPAWKVVRVSDPVIAEDGKNYKMEAQLRIAKMRDMAFSWCRKHDIDQVWSLDSDVLPHASALRCMRTMLEFDAGYYGVSTCPYPNLGFLGGFGTPQNPIAPDFLPHERKLPPALKTEWEKNEAELKKLRDKNLPITSDAMARWSATRKKIDACPPDGNIWEVIAKHGWRRRGWLDNAYPAIGKGSVVPSDWCGFGCTLLGKEALALADFEGYEGKGTEDLYVCWHRWHPAGIRLNVITHCPCSHVIWDKKKGGDKDTFTSHVGYHEADGEYRGHLRTRKLPWKES